MADIKTHLRELTVATTVGVLARGTALRSSDLYDSKTLFSLAKSVVCNDVSSAANLLTYPTFTGEMKLIVDNGFKLGTKILSCEEFKISKSPKIQWLGNNTQKGDPVDVVIDGYGFSLKEESFILKNMGLYTLLNNLTGSNYPRASRFFNLCTQGIRCVVCLYVESIYRLPAQQSNVETNQRNKGFRSISIGKRRNIEI
ncbi:MAG: hypothetical protein IJX13_03605 [Clostridia bacterium]|nr:hypothetical protein [Clostridia bacterium]